MTALEEYFYGSLLWKEGTDLNFWIARPDSEQCRQTGD